MTPAIVTPPSTGPRQLLGALAEDLELAGQQEQPEPHGRDRDGDRVLSLHAAHDEDLEQHAERDGQQQPAERPEDPGQLEVCDEEGREGTARRCRPRRWRR
jgi:hypothetical protein